MRQAQVQALKRVCILVCQVYGRPLGSFPDHIGREKAAYYSLFVHMNQYLCMCFKLCHAVW